MRSYLTKLLAIFKLHVRCQIFAQYCLYTLSSRRAFARDLLLEPSMRNEKQIPRKASRDDMVTGGVNFEERLLAGVLSNKWLKMPASIRVLNFRYMQTNRIRHHAAHPKFPPLRRTILLIATKLAKIHRTTFICQWSPR